MRILQINSIYKNGSTGRTTYEVEQALVREGHEAYVAYGYGQKDDSIYHFRINSSISNTIHKVLSRITGYEGYYSIIPTFRLIKLIKTISPDIIHLRCLHGDYINLPILFNYLKKYEGQVVMNLHDCWDITGHCPYFGTCDKWKTECNHCDKYREYPKSLFFDTSRKVFRDKKRWYANVKHLTVIAVSKWLMHLAEESVFKGRNIMCIYNWVNQEVFHPEMNCVETDEDSGSFTIVFVSASWTANTYRFDALNKLLLMIPDEYKIKIVGIYNETKIVKKNIEYLGYIGDPSELAKIYSTSDVYVHLSIEEAFGKVIAEANACGIPAIVFDCTGCAEVVSEESGNRIGVGDFDSLLEAIFTIKEKGKKAFFDACIKNVNKRFSYEKNVHELIETYERIVRNGKK